MAPTTRLTAPEEFSPRIKFPTQICAACGQPGSLRCAKCRSSPYCSRECQKAHFKVHKTICDPAIDPKNAFLERLAAEIRANVKCSREVSPAVSTIIPRISALLATLSNRSLTAWFLPGEYRTLPAGHGFRLLATPNVLVGIAILASSPDRAFGAHIKPEHADDPDEKDVEKFLGLTQRPGPPALIEAMAKAFEGVPGDQVTVRLVGGLERHDSFPNFSSQIVGSVKEAIPSCKVDDSLLLKFPGKPLKAFRDEAECVEANERFEIVALDLESGEIVTHTRFEFGGKVVPESVLEEERKLNRALRINASGGGGGDAKLKTATQYYERKRDRAKDWLYD